MKTEDVILTALVAVAVAMGVLYFLSRTTAGRNLFLTVHREGEA